jgi:hypothetical protein
MFIITSNQQFFGAYILSNVSGMPVALFVDIQYSWLNWVDNATFSIMERNKTPVDTT